MKRKRQARPIARRRLRGTAAAPRPTTAADARMDRSALFSLKLAELARGTPCLLCKGKSDLVALSIAEPGSALLPVDGKTSMRRIPYALCSSCATAPNLGSRVEAALLGLLTNHRAEHVIVDANDRLMNSSKGGVHDR